MGRSRRRPVNCGPAATPVGRLLQRDAAHCYYSRHAAPVPGAAISFRSRSPCMRTRRAARCGPGPDGLSLTHDVV
ncbi:hypothetical protein BFF94_015955 [Burkholderia catarinensis]|nr:hypothetical protein BFF94_015955 [Burkholderia catarinensis]